MPYIEKGSQTEIGKKIEELAKKLPAPLSWLVPDPLHDPTGGFGLTPSPIAISLPYATKQILKIPKAGLSSKLLKDVTDTIEVLKATPKRALQSVADITVEKPETVKEAANILGRWTYGREINLSPLVKSEKLPDTVKKLLATAEEKGLIYNLPEATSHELGHEITERLLQKRGQTLARVYTDPSKQNMWEGVAEYLGKNLAEKAKVPYTPKFPYGAEQELIFNVLEKAPSKNPYMNIYRFLQKSGELK